jgi:hypothetical protein
MGNLVGNSVLIGNVFSYFSVQSTPKAATTYQASTLQKINFNSSDIAPVETSEIHMGPGLYAILSVQNSKVYIGQSGCVPSRLSDHWLSRREELTYKRHGCTAMQEDWLLYGQF